MLVGPRGPSSGSRTRRATASSSVKVGRMYLSTFQDRNGRLRSLTRVSGSVRRRAGRQGPAGGERPAGLARPFGTENSKRASEGARSFGRIGPDGDFKRRGAARGPAGAARADRRTRFERFREQLNAILEAVGKVSELDLVGRRADGAPARPRQRLGRRRGAALALGRRGACERARSRGRLLPRSRCVSRADGRHAAT